MKKSPHPLMSNSERQKIYNKRYREKQSKIKRLCRELDRVVRELEELPKCPACENWSGSIGIGVQCDHTADRKQYMGEANITRAQLEEVEH
ncbi:MAG: hypothetical protein KGL39_43835 [Patescibacteria group bacterium]|nr:hypothetical protein [Patescibacteria group bacterium]